MNAQETPTTAPPTLYPFRLNEAKQNLGNVVTRDGFLARFGSDNEIQPYPLEFTVDGIRRRYTENGTHTMGFENEFDLFMTTPPPEDKTTTLTLADLLLLTNGHPPHREDGWTREMLPEGWRPLWNGEPCENGDMVYVNGVWSPGIDTGFPLGPRHLHTITKRPAPPKAAEERPLVERELTNLLANMQDLRTRLATAEQEVSRLTRERDDAREAASKSADSCLGLIGERDEANQRAESAESAVSRLEGELAEARHSRDQAIQEANRRDQKWMDGIDSICGRKLRYSISTINDPLNHGLTPMLEDFINDLKKRSTARTWTPTSTRMPTEADADEDGYVWTYDGDFLGEVRVAAVTPEDKFWMTPIPLPPAEQTEEEAEALTALQALELVLPMAKGYAHANQRTSNQRIITSAEAVLEAARKGGGK